MGARRSYTHACSIAKFSPAETCSRVGGVHAQAATGPRLLVARSLGTLSQAHPYTRLLREESDQPLPEFTHTHTLDRVYPRGGDCSPLPSAALANHSLSISLSRTLCSAIPRSRAYHCIYLSLLRGSCFRSCSAPSSTADALGSTRVVLVAVTRISLLRPSLSCSLLPR